MLSGQIREDKDLHFIHMRAFPDAATGSTVEAMAGDMVAMDSVKDVA